MKKLQEPLQREPSWISQLIRMQPWRLVMLGGVSRIVSNHEAISRVRGAREEQRGNQAERGVKGVSHV